MITTLHKTDLSPDYNPSKSTFFNGLQPVKNIHLCWVTTNQNSMPPLPPTPTSSGNPGSNRPPGSSGASPSAGTPPLLDILAAQNPWWSGRDFSMQAGICRDRYFKKIRAYYDSGEIVVINGVRRSGKTTLLMQMIQDLINERGADPRSILFVNCDEPAIAQLANPLEMVLDTYRKEVYSREGATLVFDEIQTIEGWERWIKAVYDRKQFRLAISGSSSYLLDSKVSQLISGRYLSLHVYPLDFSEYLLFHKIDGIADPVTLASRKYEVLELFHRYLYEGGFPQTALREDELVREDQLRAYYDSIVYRDIIRENDVRNHRALGDLLAYLMANITSPYSYRKLVDLLGIDPETIKEYIRYAEMAQILFEVQFFSYSLNVQARNNKKIYCIDNGLRNAVSFSFSKDTGRCAENLVYIELRRRGYTPYYWKKNGEVDFVLKMRDTSVMAINVTYTDQIHQRETDALREFAEEFGSKVSRCILLTKDTQGTDGMIESIPLWRWLLEVDGYQ